MGGRGDDDEAIALLEGALARVPPAKHGRILAVLAVSYDGKGRKADAVAACCACSGGCTTG